MKDPEETKVEVSLHQMMREDQARRGRSQAILILIVLIIGLIWAATSK